MLNIIKGLSGNLKLAILFVSHDLPVIRQMCDRIGVMKTGTLVKAAPSE
jgi:peptide/nickel transport system ATP-binding protein